VFVGKESALENELIRPRSQLEFAKHDAKASRKCL